MNWSKSWIMCPASLCKVGVWGFSKLLNASRLPTVWSHFSLREKTTRYKNAFLRLSKKTLTTNSYLAGRFREAADSELQDHLPKSWAQIQKATKNLTEGELECVLDSELVACWSWGASLFVIKKEGNRSEVWGKLFEKAMKKKVMCMPHATRYSYSSTLRRGEKGENTLVLHDFVPFREKNFLSSLHRWTFHQIPKFSKVYTQCWAMHVWHTFILHPTSMNKMLMKASTSWDDPPTLTLYPCGYRGAIFHGGKLVGFEFWGQQSKRHWIFFAPRIHVQIPFTLSFGGNCEFSINSRLKFKIDCWIDCSIYVPFVFWRWCLQCLNFREISAF